ncbi:MAG: inorganic phosphate transporter, partial [Succinivibrio sp.]
SLGLPTSTTVSIIFELLGAAVCAAIWSIHASDAPMSDLIGYIKLGRTATIVSGILLSVIIAFTAGMCVQFVCRVFFSFRFERSERYLGGIFCGLSMTAIAYFLIVKGAKTSSIVPPGGMAWIQGHISEISWGFFIAFTVIGQAIVMMGRNVFKLIVLAGTFALAFAFAGNDLVNFVGVPLAALDSFNIWMAEGGDPDGLFMNGLNSITKASTFWLFISGLIMCFTLFVSRKARQVVQTTVGLSSSSKGQHEQFGASYLGRVITRVGLAVSRAVYKGTPGPLRGCIGRRYEAVQPVKGRPPVAFDCVRASVNLVVASALISWATSMKLPLSTTYVTFMVAMGSSFADGAWDRETAVYRISGVITVIAGWFLTGFCAFTLSFVVAAIILATSGVAIAVMVPPVLGLIVWTNFLRKEPENYGTSIRRAGSDAEILDVLRDATVKYVDEENECVHRALEAFFSDSERDLRHIKNKASNISSELADNRRSYYDMALDSPEGMFGGKKQQGGASVDGKFIFYQVFTNMNKASRTVRRAIGRGVEHVANRHSIFGGTLEENLYDLSGKVDAFAREVKEAAAKPDDSHLGRLMDSGRAFNELADSCQMKLVTEIGSEGITLHSSEMYLNFMGMMRTIVNRYTRVAMQEHALWARVTRKQPLSESSKGELFDNDAEDDGTPVIQGRGAKA